MRKAIFIILLLPFAGYSQPLEIKNTQGGLFSLGVRTTVSAFDGGNSGSEGMGVGGQFLIQLSDRINTSWYLDYITGTENALTSRKDYHIGWSVMYYLTKKSNSLFRPFLVAGHCFDKTVLTDNTNLSNNISRGSSAVQMGGGFHLNLSERMDLTFATQYMMHLGTNVHSDIVNNAVIFEKHKGAGVEGHVLFQIGINYKIADLW
ncbi:MAG: hypothetical protein COA33_004755 [Fluviicola sp.]|nr:hypothetical protein [Fluviicola sp.]